MIEVKGLSKRHKGKLVLDELTFSVEKGRVCALLGPDGAGKTTAMDILSGCAPADDGQIVICGNDLAKQPGDAKSNMGYMPAEPPLYGDLTVRSYLKFVGSARGLGSKSLSERIDSTVKLVKLADVADQQMKSLSTGARRMASLAQAVLCNPDVILMDEPTAGLDPREIIELRAIIRQLGADHAVLIATKTAREACAVCDQVLALSGGKIIARGAPDDLTDRIAASGKVQLRVKGDEPQVSAALKRVSGISVDHISPSHEAGAMDVLLSEQNGVDAREAVFGAFADAKLAILEMGRVRVGLDDFLLSLAAERFSTDASAEEAGDHDGNL